MYENRLTLIVRPAILTFMALLAMVVWANRADAATTTTTGAPATTPAPGAEAFPGGLPFRITNYRVEWLAPAANVRRYLVLKSGSKGGRLNPVIGAQTSTSLDVAAGTIAPSFVNGFQFGLVIYGPGGRQLAAKTCAANVADCYLETPIANINGIYKTQMKARVKIGFGTYSGWYNIDDNNVRWSATANTCLLQQLPLC